MFVFHMEQSIQEWTKQNLWKTAFKQFEEIWSTWSRPYPFKYFEGCLPQILLGPVLNTLSHTIMIWLILGRNTKQKKKSSLTKDTLYFVKSISEPKPGYKKLWTCIRDETSLWNLLKDTKMTIEQYILYNSTLLVSLHNTFHMAIVCLPHYWNSVFIMEFNTFV